MQQEDSTSIFKTDRRTSHIALEEIHLFSEGSLKRQAGASLTLQQLHMGTYAEERHHPIAQALQVLVTAQHKRTHWTSTHSLTRKEHTVKFNARTQSNFPSGCLPTNSHYVSRLTGKALQHPR